MAAVSSTQSQIFLTNGFQSAQLELLSDKMNFDPSMRVSPFVPAAVLRVTGEDALTFLQGQFTQELRSDQKHPIAYGLWLNQKGKVIADSFVLHDEDCFWIVSENCSASVIQSRLEAYVIADDVKIEDLTIDWNGYTLFGTAAFAWLESAGVKLSPIGSFTKVGKGLIFRGRRVPGESWEWLQPRVWQAWPDLVRGSNLVSPAELDTIRIEAGIPRVPADVGENDLPNEAGLEATAISYSKGCYLGQEVMARLKSMGQVRRKLLRVKGSTPSPEKLPMPLFHGGKKIGELRSAASTSEGFIGLAMLSRIGLGESTTCGLNETGPEGIQILDTSK
jgi:hypothetical protein